MKPHTGSHGASNNLYLVIMAGGSGTRFWPKSTAKRPKQLLSFFPSVNESLLGLTLSRFDGVVDADQRLIVTTAALEAQVLEESRGAQVLAEPQARNTAPCIYWAAREIAKKDPRGVMMVMPSDHYIADVGKFRETLSKACAWASSHDDLVTLGILPDRPETGYGYLRMSALTAEGDFASQDCRAVEAFVEKPSLERATEFLKSGNYLWNGGMFVWRAEVILEAFDRWMPLLRSSWETADGNISSAYPLMPATSIDYGVMEHARNVVAFPLECGWDDLGSWTSLEALADTLGMRHSAGVVAGGEVLAIEARGNVVDTPHRMTALLGVNNLIVVESGEVLLVADKSRAQDIRKVVEELKKIKPELV